MKPKKQFSIKLTKDNEWLAVAVEEERKKRISPSINNTIQIILVEYFRNQKK